MKPTKHAKALGCPEDAATGRKQCKHYCYDREDDLELCFGAVEQTGWIEDLQNVQACPGREE